MSLNQTDIYYWSAAINRRIVDEMKEIVVLKKDAKCQCCYLVSKGALDNIHQHLKDLFDIQVDGVLPEDIAKRI